jgi:hypothetical protein
VHGSIAPRACDGPDPSHHRPHHPIPTQQEIAEIIATANPVLRNLRITQTYHELTLALADLLGPANVSWCAYATWASRTAGRYIRGEMLARPRRLFDSPRLAAVDARVRACAIAGNLLVFEDMGPLFAGLVELLRTSIEPDPSRLDAFLARLRPGPIEEGGQDMLRAAMVRYHEAAFLPAGKRKAELIFHASALVGLHEQTRLTAPIRGALHAPLELAALRPGRTPRALTRRLSRALVGRVAPSLRAASTRWLMALRLPKVTIRLGEDVPPLSTGRMFPKELCAIDDPELRALLYSLDRTPNTSSGSAARDWADLGDRMNFVVDLFRSRQQDLSLYRAPFRPEQVAAIRAGRVPGGEL